MAETNAEAPADADTPFGDLPYLLICLAALGLMTYTLSLIRLGAVAYLPLGLGVLGLLFRWLWVPPFLLLVLGFLLAYRTGRSDVPLYYGKPAPPVLVLAHRSLLCVSALAFVIGYYRRLTLVTDIFPVDSRKIRTSSPGDSPAPQLPATRRAALVSSVELISLAFTIPTFCVLGFILWQGLDRIPAPVGLALDPIHGEWGLLVLCWLMGVVGTLGFAMVGVLDRVRASRAESLEFLQDQLWRETRREQSRINRWLVRARLRGQLRKEKT